MLNDVLHFKVLIHCRVLRIKSTPVIGAIYLQNAAYPISLIQNNCFFCNFTWIYVIFIFFFLNLNSFLGCRIVIFCVIRVFCKFYGVAMYIYNVNPKNVTLWKFQPVSVCLIGISIGKYAWSRFKTCTGAIN